MVNIENIEKVMFVCFLFLSNFIFSRDDIPLRVMSTDLCSPLRNRTDQLGKSTAIWRAAVREAGVSQYHVSQIEVPHDARRNITSTIVLKRV